MVLIKPVVNNMNNLFIYEARKNLVDILIERTKSGKRSIYCSNSADRIKKIGVILSSFSENITAVIGD